MDARTDATAHGIDVEPPRAVAPEPVSDQRLRAALQRTDALVAQLERSDRIAARALDLELQVAELRHEVRTAAAQLDQARQHAVTLQQQVAAEQQRTADVTATLRTVEQRYLGALADRTHLVQSTSWRFTRPLRWLSHIARRVFGRPRADLFR